MVYCILPVYNEEKGIAAQIDSMDSMLRGLNSKYRFIAVNDGSTDRTKEMLEDVKRRTDMDLIHHRSNLGPGSAFKSGFMHILPRIGDDDIIITMDCDNTLNLNVVKLMLDKIAEGYDIVLGSIFIKGGGLIGAPLLRKLMSYSASFVYRVVFPMRGVRDYTAFFRAIRGSAIKLLYARYAEGFIESKGFGCMVEMLLKFRRLPLSIAEVPMIVRYDLKTSSSKLKLLKTLKEHFAIIINNLHPLFYKIRGD
jgi:dolichol-phosphate mannosyltransferase